MRVEIFRSAGKLPSRLAVLLAAVHILSTTTKQSSLGVVAAAIVGSEKQVSLNMIEYIFNNK